MWKAPPGVAEGGRTGLTSLTTAAMFILSLFLWPVFGAIPSFATAPALIIVGLFMMSSVLKVKFEGDMADVLGAFVAIIMMPFTYSIANGIMFGILTWMFLKIFRGKVKDIHPVMWVVFALFVLRIVTLASKIQALFAPALRRGVFCALQPVCMQFARADLLIKYQPNACEKAGKIL